MVLKCVSSFRLFLFLSHRTQHKSRHLIWSQVFFLSLSLGLGFSSPGMATPVSITPTTITFTGDGPLGFYSGIETYNPISATQATLTITLTNTSPVANGGYLTAFAFNNPGHLITGVTLSGPNSNWKLLGGPKFNNKIETGSSGKFDIGAGLGGNFTNGGSTGKGIPTGANNSATFVFQFTGTSLDTLTAGSFGSTLSANTHSPEPLVARFRGFTAGANSTVPDDVGDPTPSGAPTSAPEPSAILLMGAGLVALAIRQRRKSRRACQG